MTPDQWGAQFRKYPVGHDRPGRRDPTLTPYMSPFSRSISSRLYRKVGMVCGGQVGKTEALLDVIGQRLDQSPAPILFTGPNKQFLTEQFEPRLMRLLDEAPVLADKVARGKRMTKTRKVIGGVPLRLAHGGSATPLKSDNFSVCLTDEADDLVANVKGQGDPLGLIDVRGETVADFVHGIVSTPSVGIVEIEVDKATGLEFWKYQADPDKIQSTIWQIFQEGTRRHWAWPCPHCADWFIPRQKLLKYDEKSSPIDIKAKAFIACPRCGGVIEDIHKAEMNRRGVYVAPGQRIESDGTVTGEPPAALSDTYWVSGLCSPFRSFGDRAAELAAAKATGKPEKLQTVLAGFFGELTSPLATGEGLTAEEVMAKRLPYKRGEVPLEVARMFATVDVQKWSVFYTILGFGSRAACWVLDWGEVTGSTAEDAVWEKLQTILRQPVQGMYIEQVLVDSGFNPTPTEDDTGDHRVYEFCRVNANCRPAKGASHTMKSAASVKKLDFKANGSRPKYSLMLALLNTDYCKSRLQNKIRSKIGARGGLYVPSDVTDDFCHGVASEVRLIEDGKPVWSQSHSFNHYWDCLSIGIGLAELNNLFDILPEGIVREFDEGPKTLGGEVPQATAEKSDEQPRVAPVAAAKALTLRERMAQRAQGFNR